LSVPSRLFLAVVFVVSSIRAQEIKVAAAADLGAAMQKLAPLFEKQTGIHVSVSLGSSGNFFAQIQNGAPFDVFLSADKSYPDKLEQAGLTEPGTLKLYARGKLVLWWPNSVPLPISTTDPPPLAGGLDALKEAYVRKIAIANPDHAPYGRAAVAALQSYGVYDQVKSKFVLGENISQTAQFAQSGNADVGFIALALARADAMQKSGHYVVLPADSYPPLNQAAVVVRSSKQRESARRFVDFLVSGDGYKVLREYGFGSPAPEGPKK
jgi:molybdate transport system substrate-binding protein